MPFYWEQNLVPLFVFDYFVQTDFTKNYIYDIVIIEILLISVHFKSTHKQNLD